MSRTYERGAVVMVNLEPVVGSEQGRVRPCVVVSDSEEVHASRSRPIYLIVPFTRSQVIDGPLAPRIGARKGGVPLDSIALVMHLRSIDPGRMRAQAGQLEDGELRPILAGISRLLKL